MKKKPLFKDVPLSAIRAWDRNPRGIATKALHDLAEEIRELGLVKNLIVWPIKDKTSIYPQDDTGRYAVGGGNMRFAALTDVLKWPSSTPIRVAITFPENEAERVRLSLIDNAISGYYEEEKLAELLYPFRAKLNLARLMIPLANPVRLEHFVNSYGPDGDQPLSFLSDEGRKTIVVVCESDSELLRMKELLGIDDRKKNEIKASELRKILIPVPKKRSSR